MVWLVVYHVGMSHIVSTACLGCMHARNATLKHLFQNHVTQPTWVLAYRPMFQDGVGIGIPRGHVTHGVYSMPRVSACSKCHPETCVSESRDPAHVYGHGVCMLTGVCTPMFQDHVVYHVQIFHMVSTACLGCMHAQNAILKHLFQNHVTQPTWVIPHK